MKLIKVQGHLRKIDEVAYIRFTSVYRDFKDAGDLIEDVTTPIENPAQQKLFDA